MTTLAQANGLQPTGPQPKKKRWQSKKYRDAAQGQDCTMRLPGCRNDKETVVLAHRNGAGVAMKADDYDSADMCQHCHDVYDGRKKAGGMTYSADYRQREFARARFETIANRIERGILK